MFHLFLCPESIVLNPRPAAGDSRLPDSRRQCCKRLQIGVIITGLIHLGIIGGNGAGGRIEIPVRSIIATAGLIDAKEAKMTLALTINDLRLVIRFFPIYGIPASVILIQLAAFGFYIFASANERVSLLA